MNNYNFNNLPIKTTVNSSASCNNQTLNMNLKLNEDKLQDLLHNFCHIKINNEMIIENNSIKVNGREIITTRNFEIFLNTLYFFWGDFLYVRCEKKIFVFFF